MCSKLQVLACRFAKEQTHLQVLIWEKVSWEDSTLRSIQIERFVEIVQLLIIFAKTVHFECSIGF